MLAAGWATNCGEDKLNSFTFKTNQFLSDLEEITTNPEHIYNNVSKLNDKYLDAWQYLYDKHSTNASFARKSIKGLEAISRLNTLAKEQAILLSDLQSMQQSTLVKYCTDLVNTDGFIAFVNNRPDFAKGFSGHKQISIYTNAQYEALTEDNELTVQPNSNVALIDAIKARLLYSEQQAQRFDNFAKGREFENYILDQLKNTNSVVYQDLLTNPLDITRRVTDLAQRRILHSVYFCLPNKPNPCSGAKDYFIADFVLVKYDNDNKIMDMVILDSKLNADTKLTTNQGLAKLGVGGLLTVKSIGLLNPIIDINGVELLANTFIVGKQIPQIKFLEIHGTGSSTSYTAGGIK